MIILLIGVPYSGKSTFIKRLAKEGIDFKVISPDDIREKLFGWKEDVIDGRVVKVEDIPRGGNDLVFSKAVKRAERYIRRDSDTHIVIDATNINKEFRKVWIELARKYNLLTMGIVFKSPDIKELERRMLKRDRYVPKFVVKRYIKELNKGDFSDLDMIYSSNDLRKIKEAIEVFGSFRKVVT